MILKETIEEVLDHQAKILEKSDTGTERELLSRVMSSRSRLIIISGIRRCGKSTLLKQALRKTKESYSFLNLEDPRLNDFELKDFMKFDQIISSGNTVLIAFDEIQHVPEWEIYIRAKQDEGIKVILTGSNASLLSRESGTRLTGRYVRKELYPFSYNEYLNFTNRIPEAESLESYLDHGGFPEFLASMEEEVLFHILDDIIYRDIVVRYGIRHHKLLRQMAIYLISNSGKQYTLNGLKKILHIPSVRTVADFVTYFEDSYLLFSLPRFSFSPGKQINNPKKVYCVDTGLSGRNSLSLSKDYGRKLENLVFLHLNKTYRQLYYFSGDYECDFITVDDRNVKQIIQVCFTLTPDNMNRELSGILEAAKILDHNHGLIITFNQEDKLEKAGIIVDVIPAWKWLSE